MIVQKISAYLQDKERVGARVMKYLFSGGVATATDMLLFFLCAWLVFPALSSSDFLVQLLHLRVQPVSENLRAEHFFWANSLAFIFSNFVAYQLNALFVFQGGRHSRLREILLFYLISTAVALLSIGLGTLLLNVFAFTSTIAYLVKVLLSVSINYFARQRLVFSS